MGAMTQQVLNCLSSTLAVQECFEQQQDVLYCS
jgi:hypothetical protein